MKPAQFEPICKGTVARTGVVLDETRAFATRCAWIWRRKRFTAKGTAVLSTLRSEPFIYKDDLVVDRWRIVQPADRGLL
jgi:hypothetical protein